MPIRNYRTSTKFEPLSDDLLIKLAELPTIEHKKLESDMSDVGALAGTIGEYASTDPTTKQMYDDFQSSLKLAAQGLASGGLSGATRSAAMSLKSLYGQKIQPIIDAQKRQEAQVNEWNKHMLDHPNFMGIHPSSRKPSEYLNGSPAMMGIDGDAYYKNAVISGAAASNSRVYDGKPVSDGYGNIIQKHYKGFTPDEKALFDAQMRAYMNSMDENGVGNVKLISKEFLPLFIAINQELKQADLGKYGLTNRQLMPFIVKGYLDGMSYEETQDTRTNHYAVARANNGGVGGFPTMPNSIQLRGTPNVLVGRYNYAATKDFDKFFKYDKKSGNYVPTNPGDEIFISNGKKAGNSIYLWKPVKTKDGKYYYKLRTKDEIRDAMARTNKDLPDKKKIRVNWNAYDDMVQAYNAQGFNVNQIDGGTGKYVKNDMMTSVFANSPEQFMANNATDRDRALTTYDYNISNEAGNQLKRRLADKDVRVWNTDGGKGGSNIITDVDGRMQFDRDRAKLDRIRENETPTRVRIVPSLGIEIIELQAKNTTSGTSDEKIATRYIVAPRGTFSSYAGNDLYQSDILYHNIRDVIDNLDASEFDEMGNMLTTSPYYNDVISNIALLENEFFRSFNTTNTTGQTSTDVEEQAKGIADQTYAESNGYTPDVNLKM